MHIKTVVLDGFKSYGQRTEVTGFDPMFNAITGFNGSGKSNILDAICFVLGISDLRQVRVGTIQDLIFKSGQAGVNKATVSIVFDNTNPEQSPPGMENFREITVTRQVALGGKNKYMLNGNNVNPKRIHDLFCSVQLNVNNPHFLIMQGRVTKVLNMKPPEILSMLEEAAGTSMYEEKKQIAMKTIEKKAAKFRELREIFQEELTPKMEKCRQERKRYFEHETLVRESQYMEDLHEACIYIHVKKAALKSKTTLKDGQQKLEDIRTKIETNKASIEQIDQDVETARVQAESSNTDQLRELEENLKAKEKEEAKAKAALKAVKENISSEEKKKKQLEKNLLSDENALKAKEQELSKVEGLFTRLKETEANDNEAYAASQKKFEALNVGMEINEEGKAETLQEQFMSAKTEAAQAATECKIATNQLNNYQTELKNKEKSFITHTAEYKTDKVNLDKMEQEIKSLEASLNKMNYSEEEMNNSKQRLRELNREVRSLQDKIGMLEARYPYIQFHYSDPEPNFNRNSVLGLVCRLFTIKDQAHAVALETDAGGKLYNVVIDNEVTGKKLLSRGNLQRRTTFIPLNKIQGRKINRETIKFAQDLVGADNVQPSLSLVSYDNRLAPVMEFVFGNTFVCKDLNVARQVAFHNRILKRCVTLDGDVVDPAGILSGGARQKEASVLSELEKIKQFEHDFNNKQKENTSIENKVRQMTSLQEKWTVMKNQLECKRSELLGVQNRLKHTPHFVLQEEIDNLKTLIAELTEKIKTSKEIEAKSNKKAKELESKLKDTEGYYEKQLKDAEGEMNRLKKKATKSQNDWQVHEQEYETLVLEIKEIKNEINTLQEQIAAADAEIAKLKEQFDVQKGENDKIRELVEQEQAKVKSEKAVLAEKNRDIQKKVQEKERLTAQINEFDLEIKKLGHEIKRLENDFKVSCAKEKEYSSKYKDEDNIVKEASKLNDKEVAELEKRRRANQESMQRLKRTINEKAVQMYSDQEKKYEQLKTQMRIIEHDKRKILTVIADLEKKKKETIKIAVEQVSRDFCSIFSTLLPGTEVKLVPPENKSILDGLEVKIKLGNVWKENLSELSGGQKSLIALSLILAMLLFKPAPFYILDEVDAALDASHTQNVGEMLKKHFKQSQFVIVSLKNGMFDNANVLFRTRFVDGLSVVSRNANR